LPARLNTLSTGADVTETENRTVIKIFENKNLWHSSILP